MPNLLKSPSSLKRPDLKGRFKCITCGQDFFHRASLTRHRANVHSAEQTCLICNQPSTETIREHLNMHGYTKMFTCGCCNWTFESKKMMMEHMASIRSGAGPGSVKPLAMSSHAPGALLAQNQDKLRSFVSSSSTSRQSSSSPSHELEVPESQSSSPELISALSALKVNAPYIETYENAISFILSSYNFTNEQITTPITWNHIIDTAIELTDQ